MRLDQLTKIRTELVTAETVRLVTVSYGGEVSRGPERPRQAIRYSRLYRASPGDIVVSHINAVRGAFGLSGVEGVVSPEYTVLAPTDPATGLVLWYLLRSPRVQAHLQTLARGKRGRILGTDLMGLELQVPSVDKRWLLLGAEKQALAFEEEARQLRAEIWRELD